jgi:DNA-binding NarL/FixJ family response regulator
MTRYFQFVRASGYILKSTTPARLVESIHEVYSGGSPMSPSMRTRSGISTVCAQKQSEGKVSLIDQEKEIFRYGEVKTCILSPK